ncbi:hypothetical protein IJ596_07535, partial [bacterium]|nr:hypothetical protein [bacterium]
MIRSLLLVFFLLYPIRCYSSPVWSEDDISKDPEEILQNIDRDEHDVISGSVEKNIEMTLGNCIQLSLGNNPDINSAFQDILIADSELKQIWSS